MTVIEQMAVVLLQASPIGGLCYMDVFAATTLIFGFIATALTGSIEIGVGFLIGFGVYLWFLPSIYDQVRSVL